MILFFLLLIMGCIGISVSDFFKGRKIIDGHYVKIYPMETESHQSKRIKIGISFALFGIISLILAGIVFFSNLLSLYL